MIIPAGCEANGIQYVNDLIGDAEDEVLTVGKMGKTRTRGHKMCKSAG